jgi:alcohol dehydrogenase class IV
VNRFQAPTTILSGTGAISALSEFHPKRLMIVTDPYFHENGTAARIGGASQAETIQYYTHIQPDPTVALAAEGTAALKAFAPDMLVALGGGSAMDCAKAMVYFSGSEASLIAIPTTSGSGSEVTDFSILTHEGVKHPLIDPKLRPKAAILDSDLLRSLPPKLIADTGFDALSHAAEAFVATGASAITDSLAKDAFCTVLALLPASYGGDPTHRLRIHEASTMAGLAFTQAGLGLCHAISHALGGMYHIPHGRLNAILLPAVISCNGHAAAQKYAKLSAAAGFVGNAPAIALRNLRNALIRLRRELALPATLQQAGVNPLQLRRDMEAVVKAALADPCCATNPQRPEAFMIRRILEEVAGRV